MSIPLKITCECGQTTAAESGDSVTCACGRVYDTASLPAASLAGAHSMKERYKRYAYLGIVIVLGTTIVAYVLGGIWSAGIALPLSGLIWWKGVAPSWQKRAKAEAASLPTFKLDAKE